MNVHSSIDSLLFGFHHPLYPQGDPRASCLFDAIPKQTSSFQAVKRIALQINKHPNIDAAMVCFAKHFGCPTDASKTIFAIARTAGFIAHALEQAQTPAMIRPRAHYRGSVSVFTEEKNARSDDTVDHRTSVKICIDHIDQPLRSSIQLNRLVTMNLSQALQLKDKGSTDED